VASFNLVEQPRYRNRLCTLRVEAGDRRSQNARLFADERQTRMPVRSTPGSRAPSTRISR